MRQSKLTLLVTGIFLLSVVFAPLAPRQEAAAQDQLQIVATYTILGDVVLNVAGDAANVDILMPVGADPHSFSPSGQDIALLEDADIVFSNGIAFEETIVEILENDSINDIVVSNCVFVLPFSGDDGHGHGDEDHGDEDHGDEHGDEDHGDEHGDEDHGDEHGDEEHGDEDHGDEHGDEDHGDEDHGDEHGDEDHGDEDHGDEATEVAQATDDAEMSTMAELCESHYAELAALRGEVPAHFDNAMGPLYTLEQCGEGHSHDHGDEDHGDEEHGDEDHGDEDHGDEHGDEDHGDEHGDEHDHGEGGCDPHVWMDPASVLLWTMSIRDTLIELDPANAETYTANADAYLTELNGVIDGLIDVMAAIPEENRILISDHLAYGYMANMIGFEQVLAVIPSFSTTAEPSAEEILELAEIVEDEGVPAVFAETTVNNSISEQIANATGAQVFTLYSGSLSAADGPAATYIDYLNYNYSTIATALSER